MSSVRRSVCSRRCGGRGYEGAHDSVHRYAGAGARSWAWPDQNRSLWVYARDQRPWSGPAPPAAVYLFAPDRKAERPIAHLKDFKGVLHVDGYAGFERLTARGDVVLAACWAHPANRLDELMPWNWAANHRLAA